MNFVLVNNEHTGINAALIERMDMFSHYKHVIVESRLVAYLARWPADTTLIGVEILYHITREDSVSHARLIAGFDMVRRLAPPAVAVAMPWTQAGYSCATLLVTYLANAHTYHRREFRTVWRNFYRALLEFIEPSDRARIDAIAKAQWWFLRTKAASMTVADIQQRPDEMVLALLWNTIRSHIKVDGGRFDTIEDVLTKLQTFAAAKKWRVDGAMVNLLLRYVVTFIDELPPYDIVSSQATERWAKEETYVTLVRTTIELGADPLRIDLDGEFDVDGYPALHRSPSIEGYLGKTLSQRGSFTPISWILYTAKEESAARMLAVAMASHPRLGRGSLLGLIEPEFVRTYMVPAARCSVTIPRSPEASYARALRRRLLFDAGISLFRAADRAVVRLFNDCVYERTPLTPALIDNFRALPRQP